MTEAATTSLEVRIKQRARDIGFDPVGIARLGPPSTYDAFADWLNRGYSGEMTYLPRGAEKRRDTRLPFAGVSTAIVVALDYGGKQSGGSIARYARGADYHDVMTDRLDGLHRWIEDQQEHPVRGSFFFLGALLLDLELAPDAPFEADRCGTCTRCLDACPTGAFVAPRVMDATRCISYLTIEHRSEIATELQPLMGELIYGCDICQDVCPWNVRFASETGDPALAPRAENVAPDPAELVTMTDDQFHERFRHSPIKRAKRAGLARNASIALANHTKADTSGS